ncbi:hypothetical protein MAR_027851 [Mya arenaria]|uniref:Uncharacterized protein n=1 Tax=Mya arenaria TaxID=6604 RepID=A0ABY7EYC2_MYAAR|nr:hypothetical protein MAR_027851 [Mya arenaria]
MNGIFPKKKVCSKAEVMLGLRSLRWLVAILQKVLDVAHNDERTILSCLDEDFPVMGPISRERSYAEDQCDGNG